MSPPHIARATAMAAIDGFCARLLIGAIRVYQYTLAMWLGGSCRFFPSCSEYAVMAVARHGSARGAWRAARRICRCHPFAHGGVDLP